MKIASWLIRTIKKDSKLYGLKQMNAIYFFKSRNVYKINNHTNNLKNKHKHLTEKLFCLLKGAFRDVHFEVQTYSIEIINPKNYSEVQISPKSKAKIGC